MFTNSAINNSATIVDKAGAILTAAGMLAVKYDTDGNIVLAAAGDVIVGFALPNIETPIAVGGDVDIQIKDIGWAKAGAAIKKGQLLVVGTGAKLIPATTGNQVVVAQAMGAASGDGKSVLVQIIKGGVAAPIAIGQLSDVVIAEAAADQTLKFAAGTSKWGNGKVDLAELGDVALDTPTNTQVLKYDGTAGKWENAADAVE